MTEPEPEPSRLQKWLTLKVWLEHQLRLAENAIAEERARLATQQPATAWRLQHLPGGGGGTHGRGMLHRDGCAFDDGRGGVLDRDEAVAALGEEAVEVCEVCKPEVGLRG